MLAMCAIGSNLARDGLQILAMTLTDASLTFSGENLSNRCRSLLLVDGPSQAVRDICEREELLRCVKKPYILASAITNFFSKIVLSQLLPGCTTPFCTC